MIVTKLIEGFNLDELINEWCKKHPDLSLNIKDIKYQQCVVSYNADIIETFRSALILYDVVYPVTKRV